MSAEKFFKKLGIKLLAVIMIVLGLVLFADMGFRPVIETINGYECRERVSRLINEAVLAEIENESADYSSLVTLSTNQSGEVISVQSNVMNINKLKTRVADRLERELERIPEADIKIPVGTLLGFEFLHGKGFDVGMTVRPAGAADTVIISEFKEAGINQTLHRIVIEIEADVDAVIPGYKTRVTVKTNIVAAETVIVGRVPDAYTHVVAESDMAGYLNDYGAAQP